MLKIIMLLSFISASTPVLAHEGHDHRSFFSALIHLLLFSPTLIVMLLIVLTLKKRIATSAEKRFMGVKRHDV